MPCECQWTFSTGTATNVLEALQAAYNKGVDTVFPECPVPAFMLPTGPTGDDYILTFDLRTILNDLRSGILVRPQIEVWAATADGHDVSYLAECLAIRFQEDFDAARTAIAETGNREIVLHQGEETALARDFWSELWGPTLGSAAFWTFAFGLPPVGLLLLWMGQRPRIEVFGIASRYLQARSNRTDAEKDLEREMKRLGTEFKRKRKAFERAVSNLEIRVHPGSRDCRIIRKHFRWIRENNRRRGGKSKLPSRGALSRTPGVPTSSETSAHSCGRQQRLDTEYGRSYTRILQEDIWRRMKRPQD